MEFWSVLLTFVSMVGLHGERRKSEREKEKCFPSPAHHREREEIFNNNNNNNNNIWEGGFLQI